MDDVRSRQNDDGVSAEEWLARARASERTDPVSSREAFDRARLAFEKRLGERAKAELGDELRVSNVGFVGGSSGFAVSGTDGYDLWDLTERELIRRFRFDAEEGAQLSPDGLWFATPNRLHDAEGRIKLEYEASDFFFAEARREFVISRHEERSTQRFHLPALSAVAKLSFSLRDAAPCGADAVIGIGYDFEATTGASGDRTPRVEIRSLESGRIERTFSVDRYGNPVCAGDKVVIAGLPEEGVRIFSRRTGKLVKTYPDVVYLSTQDVACKPTFSRDGNIMTHSSRALGTTVIDPARQRVLFSSSSESKEPNERDVECAAIAPDGKHVVEAAWGGGGLWIRELPSGRVVWERDVHSEFHATALAWSPQTNRLAMARFPSISIVDVRDGTKLANVSVPSRVRALRWLSAERLAAVTSIGTSLLIIDARRGIIEKTIPVPRVDSSKLVVTRTRVGILHDGNSVLIPLDFTSPPEAVPGTMLALAPSGRWYVTLSPAGLHVRSVDRANELTVPVSKEELYRTRELRFSPDDRLVTRNAGDALIFWDFRAGRELGRTQGGLGGQRIVRHEFSPDGAELSVLLADDSVAVFAVPSGKLLRRFGPREDAGEAGIALERSGWRLRDGIVELRSAEGRTLIEFVGGNDAGAPGFLRTPSGLIESLDPRQPPPLCAIGTYRFPWGLCAGRFEAKNLLSRVAANDPLLEQGL